jgi:hypothetical protein
MNKEGRADIFRAALFSGNTLARQMMKFLTVTGASTKMSRV